MRITGLVVLNTIKNNLRSKIAMLLFIAVTLLCALALSISFCLLFIAPAVSSQIPDGNELENYLALIMYVTCFLGLGVNLNAFAFHSMTREKTRGNIESLLATPLKVTDVWIAKSFAVFLPGLIVGWIFTAIVMVVVNYVYFVPLTGFLMNPWIAINSFVAIPLIYLFLSLLAHLAGLTGKPATGNVIVQISLPVLITLVINLILRSALNPGDWTFTLLIIGIAVLVAITIIFLQHRLTAERIVLSR